MAHKIQRIVSGGQTGVDRAALDAAKGAGVTIGGWCPAGRRCEEGRIPDSYPLEETPSESYRQRTQWNIRDSDGTLIIARTVPYGGTLLTLEYCARMGRPVLLVSPRDSEALGRIRTWLDTSRPGVLNIAGPRESEEPGIYSEARHLVQSMLNE